MIKLSTKRKFVLIDPSFDGTAGDKWQYAMAFYDSAIRNNYDFVLLAHKTSPLIGRAAGRAVDQRNVFSHGFYDHGQVVTRIKNSPKRRTLRALDERANARVSAVDKEIRESLNEGKLAEAGRLTVKRTQMVDDHTKSTIALVDDIHREEPVPEPFNRDDFAEALVGQIKSLSLRKGDILFLHTTTQGMLESLTEISARLESDDTVDVDAYFLFHFGAEAPDARTFIDRYYSFSHFDSLKLRLSTGSPFRRVHLIATSEILRDELEMQIGLPVGLFHGLCNLDRYFLAMGGAARFHAARATVIDALPRKSVSIGVRVADLDDDRFEALVRAADLLAEDGLQPIIRLAYHDGNWSKASDFAMRAKDKFHLVNTNENDDYIRFLVDSALVLLPYRPEIYAKRVSAVLHDCAIMGISAIVPRGTTLADGREFADIYEYADLAALPGVLLRAAQAVIENPSRSTARQKHAEEMFGSDVIARLQSSTSEPSITVAKRGPIATVIMPLWGRVGSSSIFDAQIQFLLEHGYFVVQVFSFDKPANIEKASEYFWRMLYEASRNMRGSLQRIAFRLEDHSVETLPPKANAYDAFEANFGDNRLWDSRLTDLTRKSAVTLVNHVFNTRLARAIGGGKFILESHDIQSMQMVKWPLYNPFTGRPEGFDQLFAREMQSIASYDYVVNISSIEHARLKYANPLSRVITPYIAIDTRKPQYESIGAMSFSHNWDVSYRDIFKLDLLLIGDAHPANVESAIWFIEKVFKPFLSFRTIRFGIVGRLTQAVFEKVGAVPNIFYCGFVDDLHSIRHLSRVAILPDQRGSGISIKTLETLAYGGAFVATSVAFRGLSDLLAAPPPIHDEPHVYAQRVLDLLDFEAQRTELEGWAATAYRALSGRDVYDGAWRDVLKSLTLSTT